MFTIGLNAVVFWVAVIIIAIIVELVTVGLVSIWFIFGGIVAAVAAALGAPIWLQVVLFLGVSLGSMVLTRPWAVKYLNSKRVKTNVDAVIGSEVKVVETIDNNNGTGRAILNGLEWTARSRDPEIRIEAGQMVKVLEVQGVKLIVEPNAQ